MNKLNYTCPGTICEQYLRILFSSFGEEDFQGFYIKYMLYVQIVYYSTDNVGGAPFEQTLIRHAQGLFVSNIYKVCLVVLEKNIFKGLH